MVLRTPQLAGRIDNILYTPLQHFRDAAHFVVLHDVARALELERDAVACHVLYVVVRHDVVVCTGEVHPGHVHVEDTAVVDVIAA